MAMNAKDAQILVCVHITDFYFDHQVEMSDIMKESPRAAPERGENPQQMLLVGGRAERCASVFCT